MQDTLYQIATDWPLWKVAALWGAWVFCRLVAAFAIGIVYSFAKG